MWWVVCLLPAHYSQRPSLRHLWRHTFAACLPHPSPPRLKCKPRPTGPTPIFISKFAKFTGLRPPTLTPLPGASPHTAGQLHLSFVVRCSRWLSATGILPLRPSCDGSPEKRRKTGAEQSLDWDFGRKRGQLRKPPGNFFGCLAGHCKLSHTSNNRFVPFDTCWKGGSLG